MNITYENAFDCFLRIIKGYKGNVPLIIAFDGRSASGKTTLAMELNHALDIPIIHTDDFYRPKDDTGKLLLSEYDGNFDIKRFKTEVTDRIKSQKPFEYGIFDCKNGKITEYAEVAVSSCYIVEGAYSLNPALGNYADIKVFFDITPENQKERIISRNGVDMYNKFKDIWIPSEERYINHYNIISRCDIIVNV